MDRRNLVPADPDAGRVAMIVWLAVAIAGAVAVWRVSREIDMLTALARTDRTLAIALFKSRILPVLWVIALLSLAGGAVLARHGAAILRSERYPLDGARAVHDTPVRTGRSARAIGLLWILAGFLMALTAVVIAGATGWILR